jgi:hypothetical protein
MDDDKVQSTEVGDEPESTIDRLLRLREEKGAAAHTQTEPQVEAKVEEKPEPKAELVEKEPSLSLEEVLKENEALKSEKERLAKQAADSRKWGNEQNMKLKALAKEGVIDDETAAQLATNEAALSDSPFESVTNRWQDDLKRLRPIMAKRGEDVDAYCEAFNAWMAAQDSQTATAIAQDILALPDDDWTSFMLEKGKDYFDSIYSEIKQSGGSLINAYKALKEERAKKDADFAALKEKHDALKAEMKAELKSGYGKKASLHGGGGDGSQDNEEERPLSSADRIELSRLKKLGLVR